MIGWSFSYGPIRSIFSSMLLPRHQPTVRLTNFPPRSGFVQPGATDNLGYAQRIREGSSFRSSEARCLSFIVSSGLANVGTRERLAGAQRNGYGPHMTVKEQVMLAIERLPEDADFKDVKDEIAFLAALREAEDDIAAGRTVTNEEMRRRIGSWTGA